MILEKQLKLSNNLVKIIKGASETITNELKGKKIDFLVLGTLGASLLGNLLTSKRVRAKIPE